MRKIAISKISDDNIPNFLTQVLLRRIDDPRESLVSFLKSRFLSWWELCSALLNQRVGIFSSVFTNDGSRTSQ